MACGTLVGSNGKLLTPELIVECPKRRKGRECVSHDYGGVRACACQGTEQGHVQRGVTANPKYSVRANPNPGR
jgi:hypothetical protein